MYFIPLVVILLIALAIFFSPILAVVLFAIALAGFVVYKALARGAEAEAPAPTRREGGAPVSGEGAER